MMRYIVFLCLCSYVSAGTLRHCYATFDDDPCHTLTLHCHGQNTAEQLTLYYGTTPHFSKITDYPCTLTARAQRPLPCGRRIYHFTLQHLEPGTPYYFTIAEHAHPLMEEKSVNTLKEEPPYCFIEAGDWENTYEARQLADIAAQYHPDAVLLGGDYPTGVVSKKDPTAWDTWLDTYCHTFNGQGGRIVPLVMAIGNHDVLGGFGKTPKDAPFFFDYFRPHQKSYYSFLIGNRMALFILDSGHAATHGGEQATWLKEQLQHTQHIPLKIALYHVPLYPSVRFTEKGRLYQWLSHLGTIFGYANADKRLFSPASLWGQTHWLPLFDQYHVTLAFEHHDQALKRTYPLKEGKIQEGGTIYLGDGGFGSKIQIFPINGYLDPRFAKVMGRKSFFWLVTILPDQMRCEAISLNNTILDSLVLYY